MLAPNKHVIIRINNVRKYLFLIKKSIVKIMV